MKTLSVIIPLYNSAKWLPKCLDSLLHQDISKEEYEIILIIDGSPDNSLEIAEEYASKYNNIRVFSQENKGTSGARNTGIKNAQGKYIYFVDPDDYVLENSLKELLQKMECYELDVLRFGYTEVDEEGNPTQSCKYPEKPDYSSKLMDGYSFMGERLGVACFVWTYLFRTALIVENQIYFDEHAYIDDTPWLPRVLAKAKKVDSVDIKRHFYTIREGSLVRTGKANTNIVINAQKWLINELNNQLKQTSNAYGKQWYRKMIAHSVLSLLSTVGTNGFDQKESVLSWVKEQKIIPLAVYSKRLSNRIKLFVINVSPRLFCNIIHIKYR